MSKKHKYCALVSLAMVVLSMVPQIHLWIVRGRDWNGVYASTQGDEFLYSAFVNALREGRPRKNDPFGGKDDIPSNRLPESTFSIQFVPAYAIALVAKALNISTSTAFIAHNAFSALLAAVTIFCFLQVVTEDYRFASAGTLFVLCVGGAVGTYGLFGTLIDANIPSLAFLRRYEPAAAFPCFFAFQLFVWHALTRRTDGVSWPATIPAGVAFAILVFSYLYLWTAAIAWLFCFGALWLFFRAGDRRKTVVVLTVVVLIAALALLPYAHMVIHRAPGLDEQHTLVLTRRPDVFRLSELIGTFILVILIGGWFRGRIKWDEPRTICATSFALLPFVVFNQQILTGKTMQVFHFDVFIINYSTLIGLLIAVSALRFTLSRKLLIAVATLSFLWGAFSVALPSKLLFVPSAVAKDKKLPVVIRLSEQSQEDETFTNLRAQGQSSTLVFSPDLAITVLLPTWAAQGTLLDIGGVECGTISREQRKEYFYQHLFYSVIEPSVLKETLYGRADHPSIERYAPIVIFGSERVSPVLTPKFRPIQPEEIDREVQNYQTYLNSFSRDVALRRPIAYAVIPVEGNFDFTNLDRWYERDAGERVGNYVLYRLKLRP